MSDEAKHSPEPWLEDDCWNDEQVRRVKACVNACKGISTEALESGELGKALEEADRLSLVGLGEREWIAASSRALRSLLRALGRLKP